MEYTELELRDAINKLIEANEGAVEVDVLIDLAEELGIKLGPERVELEGYMFYAGNQGVALYYDDKGRNLIPLSTYIADAFSGQWGGRKVKFILEEVE